MNLSDSILLISESVLGAFLLIVASMLIVALGSWRGFLWVWIILFLVYLVAKLIVFCD
jgi:hypothetical protein